MSEAAHLQRLLIVNEITSTVGLGIAATLEAVRSGGIQAADLTHADVMGAVLTGVNRALVTTMVPLAIDNGQPVGKIVEIMTQSIENLALAHERDGKV